MKKLLEILSSITVFMSVSSTVVSCNLNVVITDSQFIDLSKINGNLGEITGSTTLPTLDILVENINKINNKLNLKESQVKIVENTLSTSQATIKSNSENVLGEITINFSWFHKKMDLNKLILITDIGEISDYDDFPSDEFLLQKINEINNINLNFNQVNITEINQSSIEVSALEDFESYFGKVIISFEYKVLEKKDLNKLILVNDIGEISDYDDFASDEFLLQKINEINNINLNFNQVKITEINQSSIEVSALDSFIEYKGKVIISFEYKVIEKINLNEIIINTNFGDIFGKEDFIEDEAILNSINEKNGISLTLNDIKITQKNLNNAKIISNPNSKKYNGEVFVNYNFIKKTTIKLENLLKVTNLGKIYYTKNQISENEILDIVNFKNGSYSSSILENLQVTNLTSSSAILSSKPQYSLFTGEVLVNFESLPKKSLKDSIKNTDIGEIRGAKNNQGDVIVDIEQIKQILKADNSQLDFEYIQGFQEGLFFNPNLNKYGISIGVMNSNPIIPYLHNTSVNIYFTIDGDQSILENNKSVLSDVITNTDIGEIQGYGSEFNDDIGLIFDKIGEQNNLYFEYINYYYDIYWINNNKVRIVTTSRNTLFTGEVSITFDYKKISKKANLDEIIEDKFLGEIITFASSSYTVNENTIVSLLNAKYPNLSLILNFDIRIIDINYLENQFKIEVLEMGSYEGTIITMKFINLKI